MMRCPNCGAQNRDDAAYCSNCGQKLPLATSPSVSSAELSSIHTGQSRAGKGNETDAGLGNSGKLMRLITLSLHQEGLRYFMVQEYIDGETLETRIENAKQPLQERDVLLYASQILDVLDYLAQQNPPIVYRDIRPSNIIIGTKDRKAHLVDFGIVSAKAARGHTGVLETFGYVPPEQYEGRGTDQRSSLYALAATMHHLLTNRDPRDHPSFYYPPVRTLNPLLSKETEQVLMRALELKVSHRYQGAALMKKEIDDILLKKFNVAFDSYSHNDSGPIKVPNPNMTAPASSGTQSELSFGASPPPPSQPAPYPQPGSAPYPNQYSSAPAPSQERATSSSGRASSVPSRSLRRPTPRIGLPNLLRRIGGRQRKKTGGETTLSLIALARVNLEQNETAQVGKTYSADAGISQREVAGFTGDRFNVTVQDPTAKIPFDIIVYAGEHVHIVEGQYRCLSYDPGNPEPQLTTFHFVADRPGKGELFINFYRERQWLRTIHISFDAVEQAQFSESTRRG